MDNPAATLMVSRHGGTYPVSSLRALRDVSTHKSRTAPLIIGWRERIALPELGLDEMHAKIDTGARTTALHASHIRRFERDGTPWVRFHIPHSSSVHAHDCEARLLGRRPVKNTSGKPEMRDVIETLLQLGRRRWRIEVSLTDRALMSMPIILGRTAIRRHRLLIDPGKSFLAGHPVPVRRGAPHSAD